MVCSLFNLRIHCIEGLFAGKVEFNVFVVFNDCVAVLEVLVDELAERGKLLAQQMWTLAQERYLFMGSLTPEFVVCHTFAAEDLLFPEVLTEKYVEYNTKIR